LTRQNRLGNLFVVSGPSGVGKGTVIAKILFTVPDIEKSISVTTRKPREAEENGQDYFFVSKKEFDRMVDEDLFMEWAEFTGSFYGTPIQGVKDKLKQGKDVILEIEIQGAKQIHSKYPDACLIFLSPPSISVLEERLKGRNTESPEKLALRLSKADEEMAERHIFQYEVINDNLDEAVKTLQHIVYARRVNDN
jgi:guanylate kinase